MKAKGEGIGGIAGKGAPIGVASGGALEREWLLRSPSETLLEFRLQQPAALSVSLRAFGDRASVLNLRIVRRPMRLCQNRYATLGEPSPNRLASLLDLSRREQL